jgi:light-regulated signal transduction histidine kinase (bacteriophytochrome)
LEVDLTNCDREPIHIIGRIQSFGFLLAVSSDWIVAHASSNVGDYCGGRKTAESLIGGSARDLLTDDAIHSLRTRLQMLGSPGSVERVFGLDLFGDGQLFDIALHNSGRLVVIEAEPASKDALHHYINYVRPMTERVKQSSDTLSMCGIAARQLRALTGFDRVMVYRFSEDGSGEVIAESKGNGVDGFLGQRFPASDIPAQARALYTRNMLRIISDVADPTATVIPVTDPDGKPLDLTMSTLRAVSPIHIEYLRNMGVQASLSVSIMRQGKLWGLFACHHYKPLVLSYPVRTAAELFGELFAYLLDQSENERIREHLKLSTQMHDTIMARLADGSTLLDDFEGFAETIRPLIPHDGIVGWVDGNFVTHGQTPTQAQFMELVRFLNTAGSGRIWASDNISAKFPVASEFKDCCAGLLAIPVSRSPRDYIVLFRDEIAKSVRWAGNPDKAVTLGPNGARLTPRKSFEEWKQIVTGHSKPWNEEELQTAENLRVTLIEVVLRLTESANRERAKAGRRQEILIAELNHRVRNILNLIRSLITQSRPQSATVDEFAEIVGSRIHALARAHDQLTKSDWKATSLRGLIAVEASAYLQADAQRVIVNGAHTIINAAALTTLALVFHELITNSSKYGALSVPEGRVTIQLVREKDDDLTILWRETGGPLVSEPRRRGFGSTIIERTIPHELGGKASVQYAASGLIARFSVPADYIDIYRDSAEEGEHMDHSRAPDEGDAVVLPDEILIVEDNLLIAVEAEEALSSMGARQVHIASEVRQALEMIEAQPLGLAIVDVNLGVGTSEPVVRVLQERNVPFFVATGYGESMEDFEAFAGVPSLTKPYSKDELMRMIHRVLKKREG